METKTNEWEDKIWKKKNKGEIKIKMRQWKIKLQPKKIGQEGKKTLNKLQ